MGSRLTPGTTGEPNIAEVTDDDGKLTAIRVRCRYCTPFGTTGEAKGVSRATANGKPSLKQAMERLDVALAAKNVRRQPATDEPGGITPQSTLEDCFEPTLTWLADRVDRHSVDTYASHYRNTVYVIRKLRLCEVENDSTTLDNWIIHLRKPKNRGGCGYSPNYVRAARYALWNLLKYAKTQRAITTIPIGEMDKIKATNAERHKTKAHARAYDIDELNAFLLDVDKDEMERNTRWSDLRRRQDLADPIRTGFFTGGRLGEVLALAWHQINFSNERRTINGVRVPGKHILIDANLVELSGQPKGKSLVREDGKTYNAVRVVALSDSLEQLLLMRMPDPNTIPPLILAHFPVFPSEVGGFRAPSNFRRQIRAMRDRIDHEEYTPRKGRKTYATVLIESGEQTLPQVQVALGHAKPDTTMIYVNRVQANPDAARIIETALREAAQQNA